MPELLITKADFAGFRDISTNLDAASIQPYILEAQRSDLVALLGEAFYYELWNGLSAATVFTIHSDLLNGKAYLNAQSQTIQFYGIKPYLVYRTFGRYLNKSQVKMTRAGAVSKKTDESDYIDPLVLDKLRNESDSFAELYKQNIIKFLDHYRMTYPLWPYMGLCGSYRTQRKGIRLRAVTSRNTYYDNTPSYQDSQVIINNIYSGGSGNGYVGP